MDLAALGDRLHELPQQSVVFFEKNRLARKPYPEVGRDVLSACDWLNSCGVSRGMHIGILAENSYEWMVYELASLRLECVLVSFPPDEFANDTFEDLAEKYGLHLLLTSKKEQARRSATHSWTAPLDSLGEPVSVRWPSAVNGEVHSLDPDVYSLVFSSGTSGKLKCILISKCGTEQLVNAYGRDFKFHSSDSILVVLPLSNFQQRLMVYTAIWYGFDLQIGDAPQFFRALKEMRPTILAGPPLFYEPMENRFHSLPLGRRLLLQTIGLVIRALPFGPLRVTLLRKWFAPFHDAYGGRIRLMLTGAAPIRPTTLDLFEKMGFPLYQVYGLTETGFVSWNLPGRNRSGSVGKLVFEGGASLAPDGEILVHYSHPQSVGYLDAEDEQAKTYLGSRGIATGDIGRFDRDGYLYIVGRKKQIIVTRAGHKLQPEPLETEIERCPDVSRAVLFGEDELPVLSAVIGVRPDCGVQAEPRIRALVDHLNRTLPPRSRIIRLVFTTTAFTRENSLLTRNLKIDRTAVYRKFRGALLGMESR